MAENNKQDSIVIKVNDLKGGTTFKDLMNSDNFFSKTEYGDDNIAEIAALKEANPGLNFNFYTPIQNVLTSPDATLVIPLRAADGSRIFEEEDLGGLFKPDSDSAKTVAQAVVQRENEQRERFAFRPQTLAAGMAENTPMPGMSGTLPGVSSAEAAEPAATPPATEPMAAEPAAAATVEAPKTETPAPAATPPAPAATPPAPEQAAAEPAAAATAAAPATTPERQAAESAPAPEQAAAVATTPTPTGNEAPVFTPEIPSEVTAAATEVATASEKLALARKPVTAAAPATTPERQAAESTPAPEQPAAPEPAASPAISDDDIKAVRNLQIEFADAKPGDKKFIGEGRQGVDRDKRTKLVQTQLAALGYDVGTIDGDYGPQTAAAIYKFQQENGLTADARAGAQTLDKLAEKLTEKQAGQKAEIAAATAEKTTETAATFPPPPRAAEAEKTGEITITPSKGMQIAELATKLGVDNDKLGNFLTAVNKAIDKEGSQIAQGESVTLDGDSMGITPSEARAAADQDVTVQKKGSGGRA